MNIQRQPGANIIAVVDRIKKLLPQLQASLPGAVQVQILTDRTTTIRASVEDVQFSLVLTIGLVVMVIFLFLRSARATMIPALAVPLSIVGTFGVMYLLGYSLNNLSLMALTISTGFVVDDAIVMIENISRFIEEGESPLQAALKGSEQIGFTILSLTVSLIAVLIPLLFMGDIVGRLFREFAITLAVTIIVSAFVSLTLTPMMSAKLLRHQREEQQGWFYRVSERGFNSVIAFYGKTLQFVLRYRRTTLLVTVGTLVATILLFMYVPKGFFPVQDTGLILGISEAAAKYFVHRDGAAAAGAGNGDLERSRGREPDFFHRNRWHQRHDQQRPHANQSQAAEAARAQYFGDRRDSPLAAASRRR